MWWLVITLVLAAGITLLSPSDTLAGTVGTFMGATLILGLVFYAIHRFLRK